MQDFKFESFTVICGKEGLDIVGEFLKRKGYKLFGNWGEEDDDCVTTTSDGVNGFYMTHRLSTIREHVTSIGEPILSLSEFAEKFSVELTTKQWLMQLPDGYRERALSQAELGDKPNTDMVSCLFAFAYWGGTEEGHDFWEEVKNHYEHGSELPSLPGSEKESDEILVKTETHAQHVRTTKAFPNGFTSWMETHHDICMRIGAASLMTDIEGTPLFQAVIAKNGSRGVYELIEALTDIFESTYADVDDWGDTYHDQVDKFLLISVMSVTEEELDEIRMGDTPLSKIV